MKIKYVKGDLLSVENGYIVHGCNNRGVMGGGVARSIKEKYRSAFLAYIAGTHEVLGATIECPLGNGLVIVNGITQDGYGHDRRYANYAAIAQVFNRVAEMAMLRNELHTVVSFPRIGAGLGGGDWNIISQIIEDTFHDRIGGERRWTLNCYIPENEWCSEYE